MEKMILAPNKGSLIVEEFMDRQGQMSLANIFETVTRLN